MRLSGTFQCRNTTPKDLRGPEVALATPSVHLSCQTLEDSADLRQIPQ